MEKENKQPSEMDLLLKEVASFDAPKVREEAPAAPQRRPAVKPDRGVPMEERIMARMKDNAAKKAEAKRAAEDAQAVAVQKAAQTGKAPEAAPVKEEQAPKARFSMSKKEKAPKAPKQPKAPKAPKAVRQVPQAVTGVLAVLTVLCLLWIGGNIHPNAGTGAVSTAKSLNVVEKLNVALTNAASDALSNLTYIKKIFSIAETDLVCPEPNPSGFGSTSDPAVVQAVVDQAAELLDGQELSWNADRPFWSEEPIQYYYDETILVISWKEVHNNSVYSFSEVKIAHGSQFRRALAGNSYGASVEEYPSDMGAKANAVVGMNGDFYGFRSYGITVYQREMYRHETASVDTCFITADGDLVFAKKGELTDKAEAEQFIKDNDIVFSVAFGPVLVQNGEKVSLPARYPIGEGDKNYSRACIAQKDDLHYILMTSNFEGPYQSGSKLAQTQDVIYSMDVRHAYTLDGGQTSTMFINDELFNRVDWDAERTMTDIIYFATALPEGGSAQ